MSKRDQFVQESRRRSLSWNTIIAAGVVVLLAAVLVAATRGGDSKDSFTDLGRGADVRLPVAQFDDGQARFYSYATADGAPVRFFVLKSSDGVVRAAFDACDTCFREKKGYRQAGDQMICNNCGQAFQSNNVNVLQGGCNPAPLDRQIGSGDVLLTAAALNAGAVYF